MDDELQLELEKLGKRVARAGGLTDDRDGQQRDQSSPPIPADALFAKHLGCDARDTGHPSTGLHPTLETVELKRERPRREGQSGELACEREGGRAGDERGKRTGYPRKVDTSEAVVAETIVLWAGKEG